MLDLSTAVTIESPFVPYSPDSCCIIPRDVSDVYQLVTGDHVVVRYPSERSLYLAKHPILDTLLAYYAFRISD